MWTFVSVERVICLHVIEGSTCPIDWCMFSVAATHSLLRRLRALIKPFVSFGQCIVLRILSVLSQEFLVLVDCRTTYCKQGIGVPLSVSKLLSNYAIDIVTRLITREYIDVKFVNAASG